MCSESKEPTDVHSPKSRDVVPQPFNPVSRCQHEMAERVTRAEHLHKPNVHQTSVLVSDRRVGEAEDVESVADNMNRNAISTFLSQPKRRGQRT
jgi:hypothetical protein